MATLTRPAAKARAPREVRRGLKRSPAATAFIYVAVILFAIWILLPFFYALLSSLTPASHTSGGFLSNYSGLFSGHTGSGSYGTSDSGKHLLPAIGQSFLVSAILVVLDITLAGLCAYGMSRYPYAGARTLYLSVIATRVVPAIAIVGPFFVVFRHMGLLNTPWALVISYNVFTLPLAIMVLKNYFDQLPRGIEEAAIIDGAGRLKTMWLIVLPLARPGLTAAGVLIFLEAWSEFFYSLVLTNQLTVPPLLASFQSAQQFNWNGLAAATIIAIIPPVVLAMAFQRNVVRALVAGYEK